MSRVCNLCGSGAAERYFEKNGFRLVRCSVCGLVAVADPPSREELERFYSFEAGYGLESVDDPGEIARLTRLAERHLLQLGSHANPPGRLLDVGCGAGFFLAVAQRAGWEVEGMDINAGLVELARSRVTPNVARTWLEEAQLEEGAFDAVTVWDVLEHLPDPQGALATARGLLRSHGVIALSTPNLSGLFPRLSRLASLATGYWTHPEPPAHLFQFSQGTLERLLARSGFEPVGLAHSRSPLKYTLAPGGLRTLVRSPARSVYAAAFLLPLLLGPYVGAGDEISVVARLGRRTPGVS